MVPSGDDVPNVMVIQKPSEGMVRRSGRLVGEELRTVIHQDLVRDTVPCEPGLEDHDRRCGRRVRKEPSAGDEPGSIVEERDQPLNLAVDGHLLPVSLPERHRMLPLEPDPFRS